MNGTAAAYLVRSTNAVRNNTNDASAPSPTATQYTGGRANSSP